MSAFLDYLREAVGDGQGGIDEALHTIHQTSLCPSVQFAARTVHALVPADVCEGVYLEGTSKVT